MRSVEAPKAIRTWRIICASQSEPDYSEDRQILLYAGDWADEHGEFMLLDGGHCSCYDWEDVDWDATVYSREELEALARSKADGGCYYESERMFWAMVRTALGMDDERLGQAEEADDD